MYKSQVIFLTEQYNVTYEIFDVQTFLKCCVNDRIVFIGMFVLINVFLDN